MPNFDNDKCIVLPEVPGLNTETGVNLVGGSRTIYTDFLREFINDNQRILLQFQKKITEKRWDVAERMAHSIKGSSATLGAESLSRAAAFLEVAFKKKEEHEISKSFKDFSEIIVPLFQTLNAFFAHNKVSCLELPLIKKSDKIKDCEFQFEELISLLEQGNGYAEKVAGRLCENLNGFGIEKELKLLMENIVDVEFEAAIEIAEKIADDIKRTIR